MFAKKVPSSWVMTSIGSVAEVKGGKRLPKGQQLVNELTPYPYIRVTDFKNGNVSTKKLKYLTKDVQQTIKNYIISSKDLYISIAGTIGLVGEIPDELDGSNLTENSAKICDLNGMNKKLLRYVLNSSEAIDQFEDKMTSSGQPKLALYRIKECVFPLPPLAEQEIIAEKLDTLLAQVETTKARLDRIANILKKFRQSVLVAAVSGKLTEEWRSKNSCDSVSEYINEFSAERNKLKKEKLLKRSFGPKKEPIALFEGIPESWLWVTFEHLAKHDNNALKAGPFGSALKKSDSVPSGYKVYGQEQVIAGDEKLVTYYVNEEKFKSLESCSVASGDILVSLVGTIGKILVLSKDVKKGIINPRLVKLGLQDSINKLYIKCYLQSAISHDFFKSFSHGGTMEILNLGILKELPISFPPVKEQTEIVRRVEQLFAYADKIEQQTQAALVRVNKLTQSILAKAFRGELTVDWRAQNPDLISGENSAESLLAKIKAERETLNQKKAPKKKTKPKKAKA